MIYIVSPKNTAAIRAGLELKEKKTWAEVLPQLPEGYKPLPDDQVYVDISGFSAADLKKAIGPLKKSGVFWGIIDPKGTASDPASFFFEGSGDYIGRDLMKKGPGKKRFMAALSWTRDQRGHMDGQTAGNYAVKRKKQKLPAERFGGWKSIRSGTLGSFFFLFASLTGESNLRSLVGETSFSGIKTHLRETLQQYLGESGALLWMETEENSLFLIPPKSSNCKSAIEAALKIIINSRLIGIERLGLSIPVEFTFALHYGQTIFQSPGKTGAVISESVNYIFHLGLKKAESGRLTISDDVPNEIIARGFPDFFYPAGIFEGIPIHQSRRFVCK